MKKQLELYRLDYLYSLTVIKWHKETNKNEIKDLDEKALMAPWKLAVSSIYAFKRGNSDDLVSGQLLNDYKV